MKFLKKVAKDAKVQTALVVIINALLIQYTKMNQDVLGALDVIALAAIVAWAGKKRKAKKAKVDEA
jgi:hypothetical protein